MTHLEHDASRGRVPRGAAARAAGLLAIAALAVGTAGAAHAAVLTQTVSLDQRFDPSIGPFGPYASFDPSLGSLTAVDLHLTGTLTPEVDVNGISPTAPVLSQPVTLTPQISLSYGPATNSPARATQVLPAETLSFDANLALLGTPEAVDLSASASAAAGSVLAADGVFLNTRSTFAAIGGGAVIEQFNTLTGQLQVTYTYTPSGSGDGGSTAVPEPTSLGLMGAGLAGLGLVARRRRRTPA